MRPVYKINCDAAIEVFTRLLYTRILYRRGDFIRQFLYAKIALNELSRPLILSAFRRKSSVSGSELCSERFLISASCFEGFLSRIAGGPLVVARAAH